MLFGNNRPKTIDCVQRLIPWKVKSVVFLFSVVERSFCAPACEWQNHYNFSVVKAKQLVEFW